MPNTNCKYSIVDAQELAISKGGKFLSLDFTTVSQKYWWECEQGHQWETAFSTVMNQNCWCRQCYIEKPREPRRLKYTSEDADAFAAERNGKMLTPVTQVGSNTILLWQCAEGHMWKAVFYSIRRGTWCPTCNSKKRERLARRILEFIYGMSFWSCRPSWLRSPMSNQPLELDCFNENLSIAAEIQASKKAKYTSAQTSVRS